MRDGAKITLFYVFALCWCNVITSHQTGAKWSHCTRQVTFVPEKIVEEKSEGCTDFLWDHTSLIVVILKLWECAIWGQLHYKCLWPSACWDIDALQASFYISCHLSTPGWSDVSTSRDPTSQGKNYLGFISFKNKSQIFHTWSMGWKTCKNGHWGAMLANSACSNQHSCSEKQLCLLFALNAQCWWGA